MTIEIDLERAKKVGRRLYEAWTSDGILGEPSMPEDTPPAGVIKGSSEHALFLTLTVALDYMRDADQLWNASRAMYEDPETRYLFDPTSVSTKNKSQVRDDLIHAGVALRPNQDPEVWIKICETLHRAFQDRVEPLLLKGGWSGPQILMLIRSRNFRDGFPHLKGAVIGGVWLRMMKDTWHGHDINHMDRLDLPANDHIIAASVMTGSIYGSYNGSFKYFSQTMQKLWREASEAFGLYPLQLDQPLWTLSRRGCRNTQSMPCQFERECPVAEFCTGTSINVSGTSGELPDKIKYETGVW